MGSKILSSWCSAVLHWSNSTSPPSVLSDRGSSHCSPGTPEHGDTPQGQCWGVPALTPGGCWEPWCAQSLCFLTLKLGIGFLIQTKTGLMSTISVFDCNIPFLELHPLFLVVPQRPVGVLSMLMRAMTLLPERTIGKVLAFL